MKRYRILIMALLATFVLSSCLKNKFDLLNPKGSPSVVEFKNPAAPSGETPEGSLYTVFPVAYATSDALEVTYVVQLSGADPAPQDVVLNIGVKSSAVTELNADKSIIPSFVPYVELPSTLYKITTSTVTIPKGQRSATVKVTYNTNAFDFTKKYALPISITSSTYGTVSKNFGTILLNVSAKNQYHGSYRYVYTTSLGNGDKTISLTTVGPNSVKINPGLIGAYTNLVEYRIDPATNNVTVFMDSLLPIATLAGSKWDPATKTLTVNWTSNGGARTFTEKFTKLD